MGSKLFKIGLGSMSWCNLMHRHGAWGDMMWGCMGVQMDVHDVSGGTGVT